MLFDPALIVGLGGAATAYAYLARRVVVSGTIGRGAIWRFGGGVILLAVALAPALEQAAERSLAAHMVQHQLLVLVVAPLLASSGALTLVRLATGRALEPAWRGPGGRAVAAVVLAAVHLGVMLAWHVPAAYTAALASPQLHHLEHVTMLGTAVLAWVAILSAAVDDRAVFGAVVGLALLAVGGAVLGVVLLTVPVQLYAWYGGAAAIDEQRVAGALMKVGALIVYAGAATVLSARWFHRLAALDAPLTDRHREAA